MWPSRLTPRNSPPVDKPAVSDIIAPTEPTPADAAASTAAESRWYEWQRDRSVRLEHYAVTANVLLSALGFPTGGSSGSESWQQASVDDQVSDACKSTLLAILADMRRIAEDTTVPGVSE